MAAPFHSTPFQPYVYQSPQAAVIPFQILGGEAQIVQIMLKPQEKVLAKPGSMCYMSGSIQMQNNYLTENEGGVWQWLFGKSMSSIVLVNPGPNDGFVGIAAPSLGRILPIDLATFGGEIFCQPDAFLCSVNDVTVTNTVDQRARHGVTGAEGMLRQKLVGQGLAFIIAGGSGQLESSTIRVFSVVSIYAFFVAILQFVGGAVVQKNLEVGEVLVVDATSIVAMTGTVNYQVKYVGSIRRMVFGGDGLLTAVLTGPGIVFIQSLPFYRLSQRIARAVTSPTMRENPKFFIQMAIFLVLAYIMIVSSLILTDV